MGYYYCFVDRSTRINSPKCPYNKKIKLPLPYNYSENSVVSVAKLYMNTKYLNITWPSTKFRVFHFQDSYFFFFLIIFLFFILFYLLFIYLFIFWAARFYWLIWIWRRGLFQKDENFVLRFADNSWAWRWKPTLRV